MRIAQYGVTLQRRRRGFHLITAEIERAVPDLHTFSAGIAHIHLQHTSAGLTLNESTDPDVRTDMESIFSRLVPENQPHYVHTFEGPDDMPAHAKSSLLGASVTVPISRGRFALGTWQGIYLCEHRNHAQPRRVFITVIGQEGE